MTAAAARLAPLSEEPLAAEDEKLSSFSKRSHSFRGWLRNQLSPLFHRKSHHQLKILLSVIGCPLSPVSIHLPNPPLIRTTNVASSADYIIRQFRATTGCAKMEGAARKSLFASGRVRVVMSDEPDGGASSAAGGGGGKGAHHRGCFVVWQMVPDMWLIELSVSGNQIVAGSDGRVAWRRTPWLGAHAAKGDVRPLRRALQARSRPSDHRRRVLSRAARRGEGGGRRRMLRAEARRRPLHPVEPQRQHRGDNQARHDGLLQPAERAAGSPGGLAADPHPVPGRRSDVLGDHHRFAHRGLPPRGRRGGRDRALGPVDREPGAVRVRAEGDDADGGGVDDRRRGVQCARPVYRLFHSSGGGPEE
ncbi:uncharacterized protein M6B38_344470 [Iris pallida]|uniref:Uncharacterized protein n=1 Tax=Iris pallida TaxID=29817 RepID=A0AAX6GVT4_IRIPA|nr:uncharacterized protein M6B38_344470 [Iris pallida]